MRKGLVRVPACWKRESVEEPGSARSGEDRGAAGSDAATLPLAVDWL